MIIKSKKNDLIHEVSEEIWQKIVSEGNARKYEIIDQSPGTFGKVDLDVPKVIVEIEPVEKEGYITLDAGDHGERISLTPEEKQGIKNIKDNLTSLEKPKTKTSGRKRTTKKPKSESMESDGG